MIHDKKTEKLLQIYDLLYEVYGECECPLSHRNPFELLVAVILSAQCTDKRVNIITPELFRKFDAPEKMAAASFDEVFELVKTAGLAKSKAKSIIGASQMLVKDFGSQVPSTMDELLLLPGVGRKTANVMLSNAFKKPGFPVDTHVRRMLVLLGLSRSDDPVKLEMMVNARIDGWKLGNFSHLLIFHGRAVCHANRPECGRCVLKNICKTGKNR
ncbi:MAG: endonuclease III [Lentisphaeria bacterium]|nr:endonuclease III [Lentisphaeria bacterium]